MQGFTVVFALFIVPVSDSMEIVDDCQENVRAFMESKVAMQLRAGTGDEDSVGLNVDYDLASRSQRRTS